MGEEPSEDNLNVMTAPVNHHMDTNAPAQCLRVGALSADGHSGGVSSNGVMDFRREAFPIVCHSVPGSTSSAGQNVGQQVDSDVVSCPGRTSTSCEVEYQLISGQPLPAEASFDASCDLCPTSVSVPPSDQNAADRGDWQFVAARRVDLHLLLDVLLARRHRDHAAREFLLSLPTSVLKKYEVLSRHQPIFVCLDIVN